MHNGPKLKISQEIHAEKYRSEGESFREAMNRIASSMSDNDIHYQAIREGMSDLRFLAGGRVQAAMGSVKRVTAYNCFVAPTIQDSFVEGRDCIMDVAKEAASTMRMGGGIGYDFSTLRPKGDLIRKLQSYSSGPIAFMNIYNAVCLAVASSGHRRGAQMGVLRVDHPDIVDFIHVKQNTDILTGFNLSIGITDEFMHAVEDGLPFTLRFNGQPYREIDARNLWEMIMRSTWDWAEPGVLFIDRINEMNNLWYCERIAATNPCGEQPLPPYGACLLGSFNLVRYVRPCGEGRGGLFFFDWSQFVSDIPHMVRAMDNVIDRTVYPLYEQEQEAKNKRRMGLGVTGVANAIEALGFPYGSDGFCATLGEIMETLRDEAYRASAMLAAEKGHFPLYKEDEYLSGEFVSTLPGDVQELIRAHGIRNSHLLSIAPTGTISLAADNVSSGVEPVFSYEYERTLNLPGGTEVVRVDDYGVREFGVRGKIAADVSVEEHLAVLLTAQRYVDSSVSKTCNVPSDCSWEDFKKVYMDAWKGGAKGCTTFRIGGKRFGVLNAQEEGTKEAACRIDSATGRRECE